MAGKTPATDCLLPFFSPARVRSSDPDTEHQLASALLRSGGLPLRGLSGLQPVQALSRALETLSGGVSSSVKLSLCCVPASDEEPQVLIVQYRAGVSFDINRSRQVFDRCQPGVLGGLLSELRQAASPLAPIFTPQDVLKDHPYGPVYGELSDLMEEAAATLRSQYAHLSEKDRRQKLRSLQVRDSARLMGRQGRRTYLDESKLGFTLGATFLEGDALDGAVLGLPDALKRTARQIRETVRRLDALSALAPDWDRTLELDEYSDVRNPSFCVSVDPSRNDPLAEHLEELLQGQMNGGYDSWPIKALGMGEHTSYRLMARQLALCAQALRLVRHGLRTLGAQEITP